MTQNVPLKKSDGGFNVVADQQSPEPQYQQKPLVDDAAVKRAK